MPWWASSWVPPWRSLVAGMRVARWLSRNGEEENVRRHNRICLGACAAIVANTGEAENHRIIGFAIGTLKIESGVCDLPRRGPKRVV